MASDAVSLVLVLGGTKRVMTTGWGAYANEGEDMPRKARGMTVAAAEGDREWADDLWKTLDAGGETAFTGLDIELPAQECRRRLAI